MAFYQAVCLAALRAAVRLPLRVSPFAWAVMLTFQADHEAGF